MVDIVVGVIPPVQSKSDQRNGKHQPTATARKKFKEKRKNKRDRRQSVRDGIVVTLSYKAERRISPDRRKK